jgi:choline-sulfatase
VLREDPGHAEHNNVPIYVAVKDGRWKYIRYLRAGETEEVYDMRADPEELTNLADDPAHAATLKRLRALMTAEAKRTKAGFADSIPKSKQMLTE